jgi:transcriptional regulator with XRE-family HTH domain
MGAMESGGRIRQERENRGWSQQDLADRVGISQPAIKKIEAGQTSRSRYLAKIASVLGIPLTELDPDLQVHEVRGGVVLPSVDLTGDRDLPVYASVERPAGQMAVTFQPIEYVRRPTPLFSVKGGYGLIVVGQAMEPEFWSGDIALVHPHLQPTAENTYVFFTQPPGDHPSIAKVGRLVRTTATDWYTRQWTPPAGDKRDLRMSRKEWPVCHRIVGKYSRR